MTLILTIDGVQYPYPEAHEKNWAINASAAIKALVDALGSGLPLSGGTMTGHIMLVSPPTLPLHAASKEYVDASMLGLRVKTECRLATTANVDLATALANGQSLDGETIATGDRILVLHQANPRENGVYLAPASGAAARTSDADVYAELFQALVSVIEGAENGTKTWVSQTTNSGTIGVNDIAFARLDFGAVAADGAGIEKIAGVLSLELDGPSLAKSAEGLRLAADGVLNEHVRSDAAIARSKLAAGAAFRLAVTNGSGVLVDLAALAPGRLLAADVNGLPLAIPAITQGRALISNSSGIPVHSATTALELAHLMGATSNLQSQLNAKLSASDVLGKVSIDIPAIEWRPATTLGCSALDQTEIIAGATESLDLAFLQGVERYAICTRKLPKRWNLGTIEARFTFRVGTGSAGATVKFGLKAVARGDSNLFYASYGTPQYATKTLGSSSNVISVTGWTPPITVGGSPAEGDLICLNVFRDGAADTYGSHAHLILVEIRYTASAVNDS